MIGVDPDKLLLLRFMVRSGFISVSLRDRDFSMGVLDAAVVDAEWVRRTPLLSALRHTRARSKGRLDSH